MRNYLLLLLFSLFFLPSVFAFQLYNEISINVSSCGNEIYYDFENNDTSCTLRSQDDFLINLTSKKIVPTYDNVSLVNIYGNMTTDCSQSVTSYNLNRRIPIDNSIIEDIMLIDGEACIPYCFSIPYTLVSCVKTTEGNYAMAKYKIQNSSIGIVNITSQIADSWFFNNSVYKTNKNNGEECIVPIFYVGTNPFFMNSIDYDACLNYVYSYIYFPVIDENYYYYYSMLLVHTNLIQYNGGEVTSYGVNESQCLQLNPMNYGSYSYPTDLLTAWIDATYCAKSSDENLFYIQKTGYYTGNHSLYIKKIKYPSFFTQPLQLTDINKVYFRTGNIDFDTSRKYAYYLNYDNYVFFNNTYIKYDGYFDESDGDLVTGGSRLSNPSGTPTNKFFAYSYTKENDLENFDCSFYEPYELFTSRNVRGLYSGEYPVVCFNKSSELKTAIKFVNATNVRDGNLSELDVYIARYDTTNLIFSQFTYFPSAPKKNDNITLSWKTRIPLTTELRIRYRNPENNQLSSWFSLMNETEANTTSHNLIINADKLPYETTYYIVLKGQDENGTLYVDEKTYEIEVSQLPLIREVTGMAICTFSEIGTPYPAYISINGNQMQQTQQYLTSDGITIHCLEYLGQFSLGDSFNITAISFDGLRKAENKTFVALQKPFFYKLILSPKNSCIPYSYYTNEDDCLYGMNATKTLRESTGSTSSYCLYNPKECNQWNLSGFQQCIKTAGERTPSVPWILYSCYDGYHPKNIPVNASGSKGLTPEGNIDITTSLCSGLSGIFNVNCNSSLSFVALLVSLILTAIVGFYSRNGIVAGLVLITSIFMFYFIGWIPVWVIIILGVISAFLIAKFIVSAISPQGSGD